MLFQTTDNWQNSNLFENNLRFLIIVEIQSPTRYATSTLLTLNNNNNNNNNNNSNSNK